MKLVCVISTITLLTLALSSNAFAHGMKDRSDNPPPHWPYHAFLVSVGLVFMTAGMLTARYKKEKKVVAQGA